MKFGHEYERELASALFPEHWLRSTIDYKERKKLIKRIKGELHATNLTAVALDSAPEDGVDGCSTRKQTEQALQAIVPSASAVDFVESLEIQSTNLEFLQLMETKKLEQEVGVLGGTFVCADSRSDTFGSLFWLR